MATSLVARVSLRRLHPTRLIAQLAFIVYALALCSSPAIVAHYMRVAGVHGFETENSSLVLMLAWAVPVGVTIFREDRRRSREEDARRAAGPIVQAPIDPQEQERTMTMMLIVQLLILMGVVALALRVVWDGE